MARQIASFTHILKHMLPAPGCRFAVVIPVGPGPDEPLRLRRVLTSLLAWEPLLTCCALVSDRDDPGSLSESVGLLTADRIVILQNPRRGQGHGRTGGLGAGVLTGLSWIHEHVAVDFVLKLDTDALVIGPFAASIGDLLTRSPHTGIVGTVGISCNPEMRLLQDARREPDLLRLRRLLPTGAVASASLGDTRFDGLGLVSMSLLYSFAEVRSHVDQAVANGYNTSEYAQGGAYALSWAMITRMAARGYLARPQSWIWIPIGEDMIMTMYAAAVGLTLDDASDTGQPFGVQASGLPFPPDVLRARGHGIIHSLRGDPRFSEPAIAGFFRDHLPATVHQASMT